MIKRLFVDIETSPNECYVWKPGRKVSIDYSNIAKERQIICVCWKWQGDDTVHSIDWGRKMDDKRIVKKVAALLGEADEVVAHNGDRFDIPWIRGRALFHGVSMSPYITTRDTLKLSRKYFGLNSHRLDYVGQFCGVGHKIETNFGLWKRAMKGDKSAVDEMVTYCKRDVELLEDVWDAIDPYIPSKSHISGDRGNCPACDSDNIKINSTRTTAAGHRKVQFKCNDCGKYHTVPAKVLEMA